MNEWNHDPNGRSFLEVRRLVVVVVCSLGTMLIAASAFPVDWELGVTGGILWPRPLVEDGERFSVDAHAGFTGGGFVAFRVTESLRMQSEILYANKSFASKGFVTDTPVDSRWVDVPVTVALTVAHLSGFEPALFAGPQFSFKVRATREFRGVDQDIENELKDTDFGIVFGVRANLLPERRRLTIEGRFHWGVVNLDETNWYVIESRSIHVLIGYRF